jgi:hypothetical protein
VNMVNGLIIELKIEYVPKEENPPKVPQLRPLKKSSTATIIVKKL